MKFRLEAMALVIKFADNAIEWIFAVGIVIVIAVGVIRWIGDLLD